MRHPFQFAQDAIKVVLERTGLSVFILKPCPHCGHQAYLADPEKDPNTWGGYQWSIICSSSHCRARVTIVADGWFEQIDAALNIHIIPENLYRDRVTDLRAMWNRRVLAVPPTPSPE